MEIAGIGTAVPLHRIAQADAAAISKDFADVPANRLRLFEELYRRTGVLGRHSVVLDASEGPLADRQTFFGPASPSTSDRIDYYRDKAGPLAIESSTRAIEDAEIEPGQITHLISVSCTGFHAPGFDIGLVKHFSLRPSVARTQIGFMGCQGVLNGLRVARAFTESDPAACVLLCSTELCSLHHYYGWDPEKIVANALFADGSSTAVLKGADVRSKRSPFRMIASGSTLLDDCLDAMTWRIGDQGFEMTLSPKVPALIAGNSRAWLTEWLAGQGRSLESIRSWAIHPGGPRILAAFGEALDLPRSALDASYETLAHYGNMSSATILFILKALLERQADGPMAVVAFGPGLTIEAALLERCD